MDKVRKHLSLQKIIGILAISIMWLQKIAQLVNDISSALIRILRAIKEEIQKIKAEKKQKKEKEVRGETLLMLIVTLSLLLVLMV